MRKSESPRRVSARQGAKTKNEAGQLLREEYPTSKAAVNHNCGACAYYRAVPLARSVRVFCAFFGAKLPPSGWCDFWTSEADA